MASVVILPSVVRVKRVLPVKSGRGAVCHAFPTVWCAICRDLEEKAALKVRRGDILGFSRRAKRRMMDRLDELDWLAISISGDKKSAGAVKQVRGVFWTLTYDAFSHDWKEWKRDYKNFWKAARRKWGPDISCVWKLESQGKRAFRTHAKFVPHFHLAVDLKREVDLNEMREWISLAWFKVAGQGSKKHFMAGTNCQSIYNDGNGKLRGYLTKYLAKVETAESETGRIWGECGEMVEAKAITGFTSWTKSVRRLRQIRPDNEYFSSFGKKAIVHGQVNGRDFSIMPTVYRFDSQSPGEILRGIFRPSTVETAPEDEPFTGSFAFM